MQRTSSFYGSSCARRRDGGRKTSTPVRPRSEVRLGVWSDVYGPGMNLESLPEYVNRDSSSDESLSDHQHAFVMNDEPATSFKTPYSNRPRSQSTPSNVRPYPAMANTPVMSDVMSMLQKQQVLIQQVLDGQKSIEKRHDEFEDRIVSLEKKYENSTVAASPPDSGNGKRKRIVTRTLSVSNQYQIQTHMLVSL